VAAPASPACGWRGQRRRDDASPSAACAIRAIRRLRVCSRLASASTGRHSLRLGGRSARQASRASQSRSASKREAGNSGMRSLGSNRARISTESPGLFPIASRTRASRNGRCRTPPIGTSVAVNSAPSAPAKAGTYPRTRRPRIPTRPRRLRRRRCMRSWTATRTTRPQSTAHPDPAPEAQALHLRQDHVQST